MTKTDVIKLELYFWRTQFRWGWIGALVFLSLLFYGAPRAQSTWNIAGVVFGLVMAGVSGAMASRAHRHIRRLIDQLGNV